MKLSRRIFMAAAALLVASLGAFAQTERPTNWFIGAGGGLNIGFDGKKYVSREASHSGNGTAFDVYAGKYFNNTLGARVGYQGTKTSDQYTVNDKLDYSYIHGDLLFRLQEFLVPYAHAGYAKVENGNGNIAGGLGLMVPIKLGNRISVVPDFKATAFNGKTFPDGKGFGRNLSATIGLRLALGKVGGKKVEEVVEPVVVPAPVVAPPAPAKEEPPVVEEKPTIQQVEEEINKSFQATALFDFDSDKIRPEAIPVLDKAVAWFAEFPTVKGVIEGHTDSTGSAEYNQKLSERRAKAIYNYLVGKGVDSSRLSYVGYGKTRPVATNDTAEGRQLNRRIELHLSED